MNTRERLILVCGVTGHQGGAVARHLIENGFRVRGLTRTPDKAEARTLANRGAEIVQGNLDDRASIEKAVQGVYGVFSVQNFWETGAEREVRQGVLVADAAVAADVQHLVYSSVGSAHLTTGLPHFDTKWRIEEHIRATGIPHTILRPVFFMQNWRTYAADDIRRGILRQPLDPDRRLQQVSVEDIGAFAVLAFANPVKWIGRELDLAGDEPTMLQVAEVFGRVMGRTVIYEQVPWETFRKTAGEESTRMYEWFSRVGYSADIRALRQEYPALATLEDVLRAENWRQLAKAA